MTKDEQACLAGYINSLQKRELPGGSNVALINHNDRLEISKHEMIEILPEEFSERFFFHTFQANCMTEPFEPFLDIIESLADKNYIMPKKFIKEAGVYKLHESIYESYFATGKCGRIEEPLFSEVKFERDMIPKEIASMISVLCEDKDIFILLNRVNYASVSTMNILEYINNHPECNHVRILAIQNESGKSREFEKSSREQFEMRVAAENCVFEWPIEEGISENEVENGFIFKVEKMEEYLIKGVNMFSLFAYDEMRYYLDIIYRKIELEKVHISEEQKERLYLQLTTMAILQGDCSYALLIAENLHQLYQSSQKWKTEFGYFYMLSMAKMYNGSIEEGKGFAKKCIELATEQGDEYHIFRANILYLMSVMSGWHNILITLHNIPVPEGVLEQCEKYGYWNHLAHIYVYCYENDIVIYSNIRDIEDTIPYFNKGIAIGEELKNDQFLMDAYRKSIMLASYNGNRSIVTYFYEKYIMIAKRCGNSFEEAMVYNGLGYNCCASEDYAQANRYFNMAIEIFHERGLSDYVIETIYNMAVNAIMADKFENATVYLEKTLQLLSMNKKNSLRVCNISKVMGLIALSSFYQGKIYNTRSYLAKDRQFLDYIFDNQMDNYENYLWDDDLFLFYIGTALIANHNGNYEYAMEQYDIAEEFMKHSKGSYFFSYPQFCVAKMYTLHKLGRNEERQVLLEQYQKFCKENYYTKHLQALDRIIQEPDRMFVTGQEILNCPIMGEVCEAERIRCVEREAKSKKKEIQFFSLFQSLLGRTTKGLESGLSSTFSAFTSNYNLDGILVLYVSGGRMKIIYQDHEKQLPEESISEIVQFFEKKRTGFAVSKFSANYRDYKKLFSSLYGEQIFSMVGVPIFENEKLSAAFITYTRTRDNWNSSTDRYILNNDDLEIYNYLFRQVIDAIKKWEINEEVRRVNELLKEQAVTDALTGLYNRQGYYSIVHAIVKSKQQRDKNYAFVYMDLDHFKYYNDAFGHHVGDALLVQFADIFTRMAYPGCHVIRLGGDEFSILATYEKKQEVIDMVQAILKEIRDASGFADVVRRYVFTDVTIEEEHFAGCSIGIAFAEGVSNEDDFAAIRKNADKALYYVKDHGRNNYKIFGD